MLLNFIILDVEVKPSEAMAIGRRAAFSLIDIIRIEMSFYRI